MNASIKKAKEVKSLGNMFYGAPELKALYQKYAFRGLLSSIVFAVVITITVFVYNSMNANIDKDKQVERKEFEFLTVDIPVQKTVELPPPVVDVPKSDRTVALKDLGALVPEPVAKEKSEVLSTKTQDALDKVDLPVAKDGTEDPSKVTANYQENTNDKLTEKIIHEEKLEPKKPEKEIYNPAEVDKTPAPVNLGSVRGSMKYPDIAINAGLEGTCVARILVGTSGEIIKVASISGPDVFHNEIENKIMNLQFTPAIQSGKAVKCYVSVPFKFNLK